MDNIQIKITVVDPLSRHTTTNIVSHSNDLFSLFRRLYYEVILSMEPATPKSCGVFWRSRPSALRRLPTKMIVVVLIVIMTLVLVVTMPLSAAEAVIK